MLSFLRGFPTPASIAAALVLIVAACGPGASPAPTATPAPSPPPVLASPSPLALGSPASTTGFAFDPESVVGFYQTRGYACAAPQPSALAVGYTVVSCELVDAAGRRLVIGVVANPNDDIADGFASVTGKAGETILDPAAALEPLAGFLGAMLGPERGEALVEWLAGHLGEGFAETTSGELHVATYIKGDDHSTIYVEVADDAYLQAPLPSPSG